MLFKLICLLLILSACQTEKKSICYLDTSSINTTLTLTFKGDRLKEINELVILDKAIFKNIEDEDYHIEQDELNFYLYRKEVITTLENGKYYSYLKTKEELTKLGFNCVEN